MSKQTMRLTDAELEALRWHTPGPWRVRDGRPHGLGLFVDAPEALIDNGMGRTYATQILGDDDYPTKEADCCAVAALPALLAELIERRAKDAAVAELVVAADSLYDGSHTWPGTAKLERVRQAVAAMRGGASE